MTYPYDPTGVACYQTIGSCLSVVVVTTVSKIMTFNVQAIVVAPGNIGIAMTMKVFITSCTSTHSFTWATIPDLVIGRIAIPGNTTTILLDTEYTALLT